MTIKKACLLVCALAVQLAVAVLPGVAPQEYKDDALVDLKVVKLDSVKTQFDYPYYSLPFCGPEVVEEAAENLGEVLAGDRIETSLYQIQAKRSVDCLILCPPQLYSSDELTLFSNRIADKYRVNWLVDGLPAASKWYSLPEVEDESAADAFTPVVHYDQGFDLGFVGGEEYPGTTAGVRYLYNHHRITLSYHEEPESYSGLRIISFEVDPYSVKHQLEGPWSDTQANKLSTCMFNRKDGGFQTDFRAQAVSGDLAAETDRTIVWTYDVVWQPTEKKWADRWDIYLHMTDDKIHWFSIINSIAIVLFLSAMVAMIMTRTLNRDLQRYNSPEAAELEQEETGWKLIHTEVFRPPAHGGTLSIFIGTGVQVFAMSLTTLVFAVLGFLAPSNRGGLLTALLLLFVFMGVFAGYYSTRLYKFFKLSDWKRNTIATAVFFPGTCFFVFFTINYIVASPDSSAAVPFSTLFSLLLLWFGISVPLCYFGSYMAMQKPNIDPPCRVNVLERFIQENRPWYSQPTLAVLIGGILPFGAVFIEVFFIMSSVWLHQFYYIFGILFLVFLILIITCAEISIVMCYFQLCGEDYHWWWRSFFTSGSSALYLFLYTILYFSTKLEITTFASSALFFGYMSVVCLAFFFLTGTIGFVSTLVFVYKIYGAIHVD